MATKTEMIHARVDPGLKKRVEHVFHELGLTTTEAIRLFFRQVELRQGLPFEVRIPNAETADTLRNADAGKELNRAKDMDDLFDQLGI